MVSGCRRVRIYLVGASEGKKKKNHMYKKIWINNGQVFLRSIERHKTSDWKGSKCQGGLVSKLTPSSIKVKFKGNKDKEKKSNESRISLTTQFSLVTLDTRK